MNEQTMMIKVLKNFTITNLPEFKEGSVVSVPGPLASELIGRELVTPVVVHVENLEGDEEKEPRASKRAAK